MTRFINRETELKSLNSKWAEGKPQFVVIYGKRRVGKTELIKQFIKDKPAIYFLADKRAEREQLKELGRIAGAHFGDSLLKTQGFNDWLGVFRFLKEKNKKRLILAIDEYPYLVSVNKAVSSIFQKGWDEYLRHLNIFLIISGSSMSMMESEALIYKSPLYGRRTGQILLKPLSFQESWQFFPDKSFSAFLSVFTITGGTPAYLLQIDPSLSLRKNIENKVFLKTEFLHNEVEFILKEELREPKSYLSILKAISWGERRFGKIVNATGLERNILMKYLNTLMRLQVIEKEVSVTEKRPEKSRKGLYRISDNFFRFWFQYVFPYKSDLEIGRLAEVTKKLKDFNVLEALVYEGVCKELLWGMQDKIFRFERVGRWWYQAEEIDVVGFNSQTKEIIFGEAKWSEKPVGTNILLDLKRKAKLVRWQQGKRKEHYILFSKSGFTGDMKKLAKKEGVFLVHEDKLSSAR